MNDFGPQNIPTQQIPIGPGQDDEKKQQLADILMGGGKYGMGALGVGMGLGGGIKGLSPIGILSEMFD